MASVRGDRNRRGALAGLALLAACAQAQPLPAAVPPRVIFIDNLQRCVLPCAPMPVMFACQAPGVLKCKCADGVEILTEPPKASEPTGSNWDSYDPPDRLQLPAPPQRHVRLAAVRVEEPAPAVVILCREGGVYRSLDQAEGFIASGGPCVLADRHGSRTTAEAITVYDAGKAAP